MKETNEIKQNLTRLGNFDICFSVIYDHYYLSLISDGETEQIALPPAVFESFLVFATFLKS